MVSASQIHPAGLRYPCPWEKEGTGFEHSSVLMTESLYSDPFLLEPSPVFACSFIYSCIQQIFMYILCLQYTRNCSGARDTARSLISHIPGREGAFFDNSVTCSKENKNNEINNDKWGWGHFKWWSEKIAFELRLKVQEGARHPEVWLMEKFFK